MTYQEECRLRAKYLLEAADGVEFQLRVPSGEWVDIYNPDFTYEISHYRRKPKKVRHERVVVWYFCNQGADLVCSMYVDDEHATRQMYIHGFKELKRETVYCEVEE